MRTFQNVYEELKMDLSEKQLGDYALYTEVLGRFNNKVMIAHRYLLSDFGGFTKVTLNRVLSQRNYVKNKKGSQQKAAL